MLAGAYLLVKKTLFGVFKISMMKNVEIILEILEISKIKNWYEIKFLTTQKISQRI